MKAHQSHTDAAVKRSTRRTFLRSLAGGTTLLTSGMSNNVDALAAEPTSSAEAAPSDLVRTNSDVGTLFPFIQSQVKSDFPLSYLNDRTGDLGRWKQAGRAKLF